MMFRNTGTHLSALISFATKYSSTLSNYTTMDLTSNGSKRPAMTPTMVACYVCSRLKTAQHFPRGIRPLLPLVMSLLTTQERGVTRNIWENNRHKAGNNNPVNDQLSTAQNVVLAPLRMCTTHVTAITWCFTSGIKQVGKYIVSSNIQQFHHLCECSRDWD